MTRRNRRGRSGKRALAEAKVAEASKKRARAGRVVPAAWWAAEYKPRFEESVETVGMASRAVTATTSDVVTRNERVQRLVHRYTFVAPRLSVTNLLLTRFQAVAQFVVCHHRTRILAG